MDVSLKNQTLPFLMDNLPEYAIKKAEMELKETPGIKLKGIQELKELARENSVTGDIAFEDDYLTQFLRKHKYDVSKAFKQLLTMTKLRKKSGFLFRKIELQEFFRHPSARLVTVLPRRCPDGCTIVLFEMGKWMPEEFPVEELKTFGSTLFCQSIRDPMTQINGYKVIFDYTKIHLSTLRHFTPSNMYLFYHGAMECIPGRYKALIIIVESTAIKLAWALLRRFFTKKLTDRMFIKSVPEELLDHFPPSVLPIKYGGLIQDYFMKDWLETANEQQEEFGLGGMKNYY